MVRAIRISGAVSGGWQRLKLLEMWELQVGCGLAGKARPFALSGAFQEVKLFPMHRASALAGSALFLVLAPGTVALLIPWWISRWRIAPPLLGFPALRIVGVFLIAAGLPVLLDSFVRFAVQGLGTPAPIAPPQHLVVSGWYRYVRNPIYVAVVAMVLGQGLLFGSVQVLEYGLAAWLATHVFVFIYEEPTLRRKFGAEYEVYCRNVRRWWPRASPWKAES